MDHIKFYLLLISAALITSCSTSKKTTSHNSDSVSVKSDSERGRPVYQETDPLIFDLIHTKLDVSFDWENLRLAGTAEITLKPHFYNSRILKLNARGMKLDEVKIINGSEREEVGYSYDNEIITINLDKEYTRNDTLIVYIDYTANPEDLPKGGTEAINKDKGLYFINADGSDPLKPQQIWTQGETQSSSAWFPTLDSPNQKSTQELYITVDTSFVTLSNGLLVSSIVNAYNGTRTDYWKQSLPHAPYLFMMAIGKYAVVKEQWRGKEVSYYVEPQFEAYAKDIFAHTPEMIDFFSDLLGVDYVWDKYAQVVVRDYVSGAMENTSATVFGEFVQKDSRALLDGNNDDIISHELFHQWFGDLVTCESWSNVPLNESFASYGEYLWREYKYGKDEADYHLQNDLRSYLAESRNKQVDLIRFDYKHHMEMFDRHTYEKGSRILHMLRKYTGDEAFFAALNKYLETNKFGAVEVHNLRLAFESVTGEDMNWFFNQWFLDKGHPSLKIQYSFDEADMVQSVTVSQVQNPLTTPLYKLPVKIDIYTNKGISREEVVIDRESQTFDFKVDSKPLLVNFDAEKMLLCTKSDKHSSEEFIEMYKRAPRYLDRYEAIEAIADQYKPSTAEADVMKAALNDPHWNIRRKAIESIDVLARSQPEAIKPVLLDLAAHDYKSSVRESAIDKLSEFFPKDAEVNKLIETTALHDSSYSVIQSAFDHIIKSDPETGLNLIRNMEKDPNENIRNMVAEFYVDYGTDEQYDFMTERMLNDVGYTAYVTVQNYGKYLMKCKPATVLKGIENVAFVGENHAQWFVRMSAAGVLAEINKSYGSQKGTDSSQPGALVINQRNEMEVNKVKSRSGELLNLIKSNETDPNLLKIYNYKAQ